MVKHYYIQEYPENFRGNIETRTIASDFVMSSIESSLTRREEKRTLDVWWGQVAFYKLLTWTGLENSSVATKKNYMEAFDIFPCYMMKFLCYSCCQPWARELHTLRTPSAHILLLEFCCCVALYVLKEFNLN